MPARGGQVDRLALSGIEADGWDEASLNAGGRPIILGLREIVRQLGRRALARALILIDVVHRPARQAGVDPALVMHYFGSKDRLFAECIEWPFDPTVVVPALLDGDRDTLGERLTRLFVETWGREDGRNPIVALLRAAMSRDAAEDLLSDVLTTSIYRPLATGLGLPDFDLRVNLAGAQLLGMGISRYILRIEPLASLPPEQVVARLAPAIQAHLVGSE